MIKKLYYIILCVFLFMIGNVSIAFSQIVINEVNHRPNDVAPCPINSTTGTPTCQGLLGTGREFVELYNPTCNAFDLSGFIIASRSDVVGNDYGGAFRFPAGASIPPNGIVSFGSGDVNAPAVTYGYNAAPAGDKRVGPKGWLLPNTEGWIALYRPNGTCYQLVYYASSGEGTACITNGSSEFLQNPLVPTNSGAITLLSANAVFTSTPAVCQYIGPYANVNTSMARVPDGGTWQTNRAATPTACNSTCNVISTINFTAIVTQPTCGNNNGSITLNVTSAGAATFSWSPNPSPAPTNTASSTTANNLSASSYTISVTQAGCTKDTIITLTATGKPNAGSNQTGICAGTSATLTGTAPTTGTWSAQTGNPAGATLGSTTGGIATVSFATSASGIYNFIYTANGCTDTMNVTVNPKPNAGANQTGICAGTSATLTGTAPTTGTWSAQTGNPAGATLGSTTGGIAPVSFATSASGIYSFIYTANGCTDTMNVAVNPKPNAGVDQTVSCFSSGSATMAASGTGAWTIGAGSAGTATITTPGSPTTTVTGFSVSGNYFLVWTNSGCSDTSRITANNTCGCTDSLTLSMSKVDNTNCSPSTCNYTGPALVINELLIDKSGENTILARTNLSAGSEWVELYNPNPCQALDLSCYMLGNYSNENGGAVSEPAVLFFPPGTSIPPLGFLTIGGANSGADRLPAANLSGFIGNRFYLPGGIFEGGWIGIWNSAGTIVDAVYWMDNSRNINSTVATASFTTSPGTVTNSNVPFSCPYRGTLPTARAIANASGPITRIGGIAQDSKFAFRNIDAGTVWTFNGNTGTQGACNATCATPNPPSCNGTATATVTAGAPGPYTYEWDATAGNQTSQTAINLCAGTYCVTVKNTAGNWCKTQCITINTIKPNAGINQTTCAGTTATLTGTSPTTGTWTLQTGNPAGATLGTTTSGVASVSFATSASGIYNFIYTSGGCTDTMNVTVTAKPNAGINQTTCAGTAATLTGTSPTTGTWTLQTGNPAGATLGTTTSGVASVSFATSASGIYNFIYTSGGCSDTMNVTVTAKPNAGIGQTVSCYITGTATMAGSGTGTWTFAVGNAGTATITTPSSPTTTITNFSASGTYNLVWTNNGCSDTARITANNNCSCPITNNNLTAPVSPNCAPYNGTTINASTASPVGGTYTWQYSNGGAFANASGTNNTEDYTTGVLGAGTHQFRRLYTTTSGIICSDTSNTVTIVITSKPNAGVDQTVSCYITGTATMAGIGSGTWTLGAGSAGTATITTATNPATTITNFSALGVYNLVWTNNGCSDTARITVNNSCSCPVTNNNLTAPLSPNCAPYNGTTINGSTAAPSGGSYTWQYSNGGAFVNATGTNNTEDYTTGVLPSGTHQFRRVYTTTSGIICSDTSNTVTIVITSKPNAGVDQTVSCYITGTATMAGIGIGTWSLGAGSAGTATITTATNPATTITNFSASGIYNLVWTNNGCSDTARITVNNSCSCPVTNNNLTAPLSPNCTPYNGTIINGSAAAPSGGTYSWQYSNGGAFVNATGTNNTEDYTTGVLPSGTHQFRRIYTTLSGIICSDTSNVVTIVVNDIPNANAGIDKVITCSNPTTLLNGSSSTAGVSYSWTGLGIVSGGNTATPTVNAAGAYSLTVTVIATNCKQTDIADVTSSGAIPNVNAGTDKILTCTQTSVVLNGSSSTTGVTYSWTGPGIVTGGNTATPTVNVNGTYILAVTITATGCQNTDQVDVVNNTTLPNASAGSDKILTCSVTDVILDGSSTTSGVSYSWNGPGIVSGGSSATPKVNQIGTYTLTVTNTSNGCTKTDQVDVTSSGTLPNANAGIDKNISCGNPTVTLGGISTANVTFSWTGPGIISGSNTSTPIVNAAGIYTLTVTDIATGCKNTDQAVVTSTTTPPNITIQNPKILTCTITSTTLTAISNSTNLTYIWTGPGIVNGANTSNPEINAAGIYTLNSRDTITGCSNSSSITVQQNIITPDISITVSKNPVDIDEDFQLTATSSTTIQSVNWQPDSLVYSPTAITTTASINKPTYFVVEVTNNLGCKNKDSVLVNISQVECLYLPNTFTPNKNGRNETFKPLGIKLKSLDIFRIFDRWGNLVFETSDINTEGWNGTFLNAGKELEPGVFVFYIEGTCITNNKQFIKGDVTLIR